MTFKRFIVIGVLGVIGSLPFMIGGYLYFFGLSEFQTEEPTEVLVATEPEPREKEYRLRLYDDPDCEPETRPDQEIVVTTDFPDFDYFSDAVYAYVDTIGDYTYMYRTCKGPAHGIVPLYRYNRAIDDIEIVGAFEMPYGWYFKAQKKYIEATGRDLLVTDLTAPQPQDTSVRTLNAGETFDRVCEFICEQRVVPIGTDTIEYDIYTVVEQQGRVVPINTYLRTERYNLTSGELTVVRR